MPWVVSDWTNEGFLSQYVHMSDAVPLPSYGEVFFDPRGQERVLRVTWHNEMLVLSIWRGEMCTGTFRMPAGDVEHFFDIIDDGLAEVQAKESASAPQQVATTGVTHRPHPDRLVVAAPGDATVVGGQPIGRPGPAHQGQQRHQQQAPHAPGSPRPVGPVPPPPAAPYAADGSGPRVPGPQVPGTPAAARPHAAAGAQDPGHRSQGAAHGTHASGAQAPGGYAPLSAVPGGSSARPAPPARPEPPTGAATAYQPVTHDAMPRPNPHQAPRRTEAPFTPGTPAPPGGGPSGDELPPLARPFTPPDDPERERLVAALLERDRATQKPLDGGEHLYRTGDHVQRGSGRHRT